MRENMKKTFAAVVALVVLTATAAAASASGAAITTGAGYKSMVEGLCAAFRAQGGEIEEMYGGHIGQMLVQIAQGSGVNIVISDKGTLDAAPGDVRFERYEALGETPLVLAWRKGVTIERPEDLEGSAVGSVCYPDAKSAIYGRAAVKFLETSGIGPKITGKLSEVSSVPQVFAYLLAGEMDAGFVNRVMIVNGGDKIGGSMEITEGYDALHMVAAVVEGHASDPQVAKFLAFLASDEGRAILKKNGVW